MRLGRIVVGMDLGEAALAAARWVRRDLAPAADVLLVHVAGSAPSDAAAAGPLMGSLRAVAEALRPLGTGHVYDEVRVGDAASGIAEAAVRWEADLVVVGAHGADLRDGLGGTAQRLVGTAPVPVLVAAGTLAGPPLRLLVPVEGGDIGMPTLDWARTLEERFDAHLAILLVDGRARAAGGSPPGRPRWRDLAASRRPDHLFVDAVSGDPSAVIVAEAERFHSDLVLMDAGDDPPDATPRAATFADVLRRASCSVLVTRDRTAPPHIFPIPPAGTRAELRS